MKTSPKQEEVSSLGTPQALALCSSEPRHWFGCPTMALAVETTMAEGVEPSSKHGLGIWRKRTSTPEDLSYLELI